MQKKTAAWRWRRIDFFSRPQIYNHATQIYNFLCRNKYRRIKLVNEEKKTGN